MTSPVDSWCNEAVGGLIDHVLGLAVAISFGLKISQQAESNEKFPLHSTVHIRLRIGILPPLATRER